ncbi:PIR protein [Plasmodium ovale]|uniref:PIR protein n=1 Tax=Plasmodium ovale TaxID=36330 RepID=A0A1D3JCZ6_PLAOA|nr:PIR protein [Plasmodium ovale]
MFFGNKHLLRLLYKYFNELVNDHNKCGTYCNEVKSSSNMYLWIHDFCVMFLRNLKEVNKMRDASGKYPCLHLNYWAYDKIKKKIKNPISNIHDTLIFPKAYKIGEIVNRESNENYHYDCFYSGDCGFFNISHNAYNTINKLKKNNGKSSNKGENISSYSIFTGINGVTNSVESDGVVEFSYLRYTAKDKEEIYDICKMVPEGINVPVAVNQPNTDVSDQNS